MNERPRTGVAIITPNPTPYRVGLFRRIAQFEDIALKVYFLTGDSPTRPWKVDLGGFEHEFLPEVSIPVGGKDKARYRINPSILSRFAERPPAVTVIAGYNHFTTQLAIIYSVLNGIPWCLMSESHIAKKRSRFKVAVKHLLLAPVLRTMSVAMVTGTLSRKYMESMGIPPERCFVVANTPDVTALKDAAARLAPERDKVRTRFGVGGKKTILFVGRLLEVKGVRVLFDAFEKARTKRSDLALLVVGDGAGRKTFEQLAESKGLWDAHFLGFRSQEELPEIYAAADLFVLPSLSEPWGVVVNEAMASGLPIVASDQVGAAADLVEDGQNGRVVAAGSADALAEAILDVFSNETRRKEMGERSSRIMNNWDYETSAMNFHAAIETALRGKGGRE